MHRWLLLGWFLLHGCLLTLNKSKKLIVILQTLNKSKYLIVILLTLNKSKKLIVICWLWTSQKLALQNSFKRNWMPEQLFGLLIHVTSTRPWLLRPVRVSTSSELYPGCFRLPTFLDCSGIQFFSSPPFLNTVS